MAYMHLDGIEYDLNEWFDVLREVKPDLTREEFEESWEGFKKHLQKIRDLYT